jgi:hypothetical protein
MGWFDIIACTEGICSRIPSFQMNSITAYDTVLGLVVESKSPSTFSIQPSAIESAADVTQGFVLLLKAVALIYTVTNALFTSKFLWGEVLQTTENNAR